MAIAKRKNKDGIWEVIESPDAIKYTGQNLTDDQKKQARDNIDAITRNDIINFNSDSFMETAQLGEELVIPYVLEEENPFWVVPSSNWNVNTLSNGTIRFNHTLTNGSKIDEYDEPLEFKISESGQIITDGYYIVSFTLNRDVSSSSYKDEYIIVELGGTQAATFYGKEQNPVKLGIKPLSEGNLSFKVSKACSVQIRNISVKKIGFSAYPTYEVTDSKGKTSLQIRATDASLLNTFIGVNTGRRTINGSENVGIGYDALQENSTGFWNTAVGYNALRCNESGSRNIAIGKIALENNKIGKRNIAIGTFSLNSNTSGDSNIAIGADSVQFNTTGSHNIGIGQGSLNSNQTGIGNIAIGRRALTKLLNKDENIAIGKAAMAESTSGTANFALGGSALYACNGYQNIAIGTNAGMNSTANTMYRNIFIGNASGSKLGGYSNNNIFIGHSAGSSLTTGNSNIIIGGLLQLSDGNYQLNIGDLLKGSLNPSNKYLNIDGDLKIKDESIDNIIDKKISENNINSGSYPIKTIKGKILQARDMIKDKPLVNYKVYGTEEGLGELIQDESNENNGKYKIDIEVYSPQIFNKGSQISETAPIYNYDPETSTMGVLLGATFNQTSSSISSHSSKDTTVLYVPCKPNTLYSIKRSKLTSEDESSTSYIYAGLTSEKPAVGTPLIGTESEDGAFTPNVVILPSNNSSPLSLYADENTHYIVVYIYNGYSNNFALRDKIVQGLQIIEGGFSYWIAYYNNIYSCYLDAPLYANEYIDFKTQKVYHTSSTVKIELPTIYVPKPDQHFIRSNGKMEAEYYVQEFNNYTNKTIVCFGDSITGNYSTPTDYPTKVGEITTARTINCGFGGCRMANTHGVVYGPFTMVELVNAIVNNSWDNQIAMIDKIASANRYEHLYNLMNLDFNDVDIITIAYGTNDIAANTPIGNSEINTQTYIGSASYIVQTLLAKYPHLKIYFLTPIFRTWMAGASVIEDSDSKTFNGVPFTAYGDALIDFGREMKIPVIDMYHSLGFNKYNRLYYFPETDGTHPNENGMTLMAERISQFIPVSGSVSKEEETKIITDSDDILTLEHNQEYRLGELTSLTLAQPGTVDNHYESYLCFSVGENSCNFACDSRIKLRGDDVDEYGYLNPELNSMYEIAFKKVNEDSEGTPIIVGRVGVI